jgi:hypothetical protein
MRALAKKSFFIGLILLLTGVTACKTNEEK